MRYLVNYIRSCFCKHDFKFDETYSETLEDGKIIRQGLKVSCLCKKCAYHNSWWKVH